MDFDWLHVVLYAEGAAITLMMWAAQRDAPGDGCRPLTPKEMVFYSVLWPFLLPGAAVASAGGLLWNKCAKWREARAARKAA